MATNEILQIVVFSIFFGVATAAWVIMAKLWYKGLKLFRTLFLKMVNYVMNFAPLGVFGAISAVIATKGFGVFLLLRCYTFVIFIGIALLMGSFIVGGFFNLAQTAYDIT